MSQESFSKSLKERFPHFLGHVSEKHALGIKNNKHLLDNKSQTMLS